MPSQREPSLDSTLPDNTLQSLVLLLLAERPDHGYSLVERLEALGYPVGSPSRLYRMLRRLDDRGLVASAWSPGEGGREKRVYEPTTRGIATLRSNRAEQARAHGFSARILDRYIAHRIQRHEEILRSIESGADTIEAVVEDVYRDVDAGLHPLAAHSVRAHARLLTTEGAIAWQGERLVPTAKDDAESPPNP